jgi:FMN phosphatase YigB (HAD superfamily)
MTIKVICSDCDGVISNLLDREYKESGFYVEVRKKDPDLYNKINDLTFGNKNKCLARAWMSGVLTYKQINRILAENLGCDYEYLNSCIEKGTKELKLDWDLINLYQKYRGQGIKVFMTTDNIDIFSEACVTTNNLEKYFDGIYNSFYEKRLKIDNDLQTFRDIANNNSLKFEQVLVIDDTKNIIEQARKAGFSVFLYNWDTYGYFRDWFEEHRKL